MNARLLFDARAQLGEGAIWNAVAQRLYWVDIEGRKFNIFDPVGLKNTAYDTGKRAGTVVPAGDKTVLVALEDGIATIDLSDGSITYKLYTSIHLNHNKRFNDGKCDHTGRFWVGTLSMDGIREVSALYCLEDDFSLTEKIGGVSISNGISWSMDGKLMYYIDTPTGSIVQYDFDHESREISNRKLIVKIPEALGYPDGMTVDSAGMLWVALWDGFCVARFDPRSGELLQKIHVPAPKVSSCAFGGKNLDTLFITTARVEMTADELEKYPLAGGLFAADVNIKGLKANHFKL